MKNLRKFFKSNGESILFIYIVASVVLHVIYNSYIKELNFEYLKYYVDSPLYTINNLLVIAFSFLNKIFSLNIYSMILDITTSLSIQIFNIILNIPLLSTLVNALNWSIMYVLAILLCIIFFIKKTFAITIKISIVILIIYIAYTLFYQYSLSKQYLELDYISSTNYSNCSCEKVSVVKVVDGDTLKVNYNNEEITIRMLYIDTPESTTEVEEYGYEASSMLKSIVNNSSEIYIEFDGEKYDKYGRVLAWVWVDGILAQEILTKNGLVEDFYDYGNYKYEDIMQTAMNYAKNEHVNIYK